uniref:C3H1-type domain-containing protein n=1 Tax=Chromera velia CCMP2878 TaxID=1169474 RepID=A0A0G4HTQ9_9ALVE|eukprot:Cvel_8509.t1-p1 / transcript=Cvel_8509.t1 / gene=Cvel_8509 / organism=Chromera_velia_CCMP2878 / gene_product=hypothetical protein / transcript_product=hypothetical protein / location=Cvel_scaffold471:14598-24336(+) / protein_length=903 / sequence_SO=supercontig / SO=protein_coding / is_pseudo=false
MSGKRGGGYDHYTMAGGGRGRGDGSGNPKFEFLPRDKDPDVTPEELRRIAAKVVANTKGLLDPSLPTTTIKAKEGGWASVDNLVDKPGLSNLLKEAARKGYQQKRLFLQIIRESKDIFEISQDGAEMRRRDWRDFLAREHDKVCPKVLFNLPCKGQERANCHCAHVRACFMRKEYKNAYCIRHYRHKLLDWFACPYREFCHEAHSKEEINPALSLREPTIDVLSIPEIQGKPVEPRVRFKAEKPCRGMLLRGACFNEAPERCRFAHHPKELDPWPRRKREMMAYYCTFGKSFDFGCPYGSDHCFYPHIDDPEDPHIKFQKRMIDLIQQGAWANVYHHVFTSFDETQMKYSLDHIEGWLYTSNISRQREVAKIFLRRLATGQGVTGTPERRDNVMLEFALYVPGMLDECLMWCHRGANLGTREVPSLPLFFKHLYDKGVRENIFKLEMVHDMATRKFASPLFDLSYEKGHPGRLRFYREAFEIAYQEEQEFLEAERKGDKWTSMGNAGYGNGDAAYEDPSSSEDEQETEQRELELRKRLHRNHPEYQKGGILARDSTHNATIDQLQTMADNAGSTKFPGSPLGVLPRTPLEIFQRLYLEAASIDHEHSLFRELNWILRKTGKYPELVSTFLHWALLDKPPLMYEVAFFQSQIDRKNSPQQKETFHIEIEDFDSLDMEEEEEEGGDGRSKKKFKKTDWSAFGKWRPKPLDPIPFTLQTRAFALDLVLNSTSYSKMSVELLVEFFDASPIMPIRDLVSPGNRPAVFSAQTSESVLYLLRQSGRTVEDLKDELVDLNQNTLLHAAAAWNREDHRQKEISRGRKPKSLHGGLLLLRKFTVEMIRMMMYEKDNHGRHPKQVADHKKNKEASKLLRFLDLTPDAGFEECMQFIDKKLKPLAGGQGGNVRQ